MDQTNAQWQNFFVNVVLKELWDAGYRGFFLDTLDSYKLFAKYSFAQHKQKKALIQLIKSIKKHYPGVKLVLNRGFELLPELHQYVKAVTAESLYHGYNFKQKAYVKTSRSDQKWLLNKLSKAKKYGLKVYVIDYMSLNNRKEARASARKLASKGFIPWVSEISLTKLGVGL